MKDATHPFVRRRRDTIDLAYHIRVEQTIRAAECLSVTEGAGVDSHKSSRWGLVEKACIE